MTKTITIRLKGREIKLVGSEKEKVYLHSDLIENLYTRFLNKGLKVDIDKLFNSVIKKG